MIGLGTFYNALGVVFGGLLGLFIGQRLSENFHETLLKVTGVAVFVLGIAGTLEKMLVVHGSHVGESRQYDVDSESSNRDRYRGTLED